MKKMMSFCFMVILILIISCDSANNTSQDCTFGSLLSHTYLNADDQLVQLVKNSNEAAPLIGKYNNIQWDNAVLASFCGIEKYKVINVPVIENNKLLNMVSYFDSDNKLITSIVIDMLPSENMLASIKTGSSSQKYFSGNINIFSSQGKLQEHFNFVDGKLNAGLSTSWTECYGEYVFYNPYIPQLLDTCWYGSGFISRIASCVVSSILSVSVVITCFLIVVTGG